MVFENLLTKGIKDKILGNNEIIAVLLYGSYSRGEKLFRDIDLCIVLDKKYPNIKMSKKRLSFLKMFNDKIDLQIYQQLPIYIRNRVLKDGKILLCKDSEQLYDIIFKTIKEYNLFDKIYEMYLREVENGQKKNSIKDR